VAFAGLLACSQIGRCADVASSEANEIPAAPTDDSGIRGGAIEQITAPEVAVAAINRRQPLEI
jgi:hypothetical protein